LAQNLPAREVQSAPVVDPPAVAAPASAPATVEPPAVAAPASAPSTVEPPAVAAPASAPSTVEPLVVAAPASAPPTLSRMGTNLRREFSGGTLLTNVLVAGGAGVLHRLANGESARQATRSTIDELTTAESAGGFAGAGVGAAAVGALARP